MKPTQRDTLLALSEGINAVIDNWDIWDDEQKKNYLWSLQMFAERARPTKMQFGVEVKS